MAMHIHIYHRTNKQTEDTVAASPDGGLIISLLWPPSLVNVSDSWTAVLLVFLLYKSPDFFNCLVLQLNRRSDHDRIIKNQLVLGEGRWVVTGGLVFNCNNWGFRA